MNGWSNNNHRLRTEISKFGDPDVICLTETHLTMQNTIAVEGYRFYGENRKPHPSLTNVKGSGGIGMLIKHAMYEQYAVEKCYSNADKVLGIKFTERATCTELIVYCIYLPPESSRYGLSNEDTLNKLTIELYRHVEADGVVICGDLNARIGSKLDCQDIDDVPKRLVLDTHTNPQGERLLTFVNDVKACIINGRVTPQWDGYTSVAPHKGKAVVDYFITRQSDFNMIKTMKVIPTSDIVERQNLHHLLSGVCKLPDHNLLSMEIELSRIINEELDYNSLGRKEVKRVKSCCRLTGDRYMNSELAERMIPSLLMEIDEIGATQAGMNHCYESLVDFIIEEATSSNSSKRSKRKSRKHKDYWDDELSVSWKKIKESERVYCSTKHRNSGNRHAQMLFQKDRKAFDKLLKNKKKSYYKGKIDLLEQCNVSDPNKFWNYINNLGPNKNRSILWEIEHDGEIRTDKNLVLNKWKCAFEELYTHPGNNFDDSFKYAKLNEQIPVKENDQLNRPLTFKEVERVIDQLKPKKAAGIDMVPNELLKNSGVKTLLFSLFRVCLNEEVIPDMWRLAVIHPIPKIPGKVIDPMKYRGIALQCCIFKVLSSVINQRVTEHLEQSNYLSDEQNGFRKNRSCLHHVFNLMTIIRKECLQKGSSVFTAFIDFRKAFDFVQRDLMFWTMEYAGITGQILNLTKQMYTDTSNTIRINGLLSETFNSTNGVLQGNNYSPTIFITFINGLIQELKESGEGIQINDTTRLNSLAYADDMVLLATSKAGLQKLLDITNQWCRRWRVTINVDKTKVVHFRRGSAR